ncbi:MAG: indolepyruvate ferredoxin oxidoreductase family protein [Burkholderiales bacterium]|nr:indolepyruvate ferredoxin oxidoreductase family protein [Burkholderiales bacterium]OUT77732.1 MAG: indolepyruvate ferredoxin oxidoreductase [Betaproteobacteria bacterium TMED22]|tara:strand:- start:27228 stop:30698 length:3471 start_codon:yes stop_codon:yes gene_type:complete
MKLRDVDLDDKYVAEEGRIFLNGTQALVRLPLMQHARDKKSGLNTAGYISGYRGSPLGQFDQQLWIAKKHLQSHDIVFQSGVNEDLAATALWGAQQAGMHGNAKYDGVFGIWYGKGPGVDRSGDIFRHANLAGTHPNGGVLALMGDDHTCESSTTAHQSEFALVDAMMPILNPAGVQELLDYGLYGWALSRYSGTWVGLKCMKDTIDASATVDVGDDRVKIIDPDDFEMPQGGLSLRFPDPPLDQEERLHKYKLEAVKAFVRANGIDRVEIDGGNDALGIVTCGKSYLDVRQALHYLGIDDERAKQLGVSVYKVGMTWPLEPLGISHFAKGLKKILVVEEKRGLLEPQVKDILYSMDQRPVVIGKKDEKGLDLLKSNAALEPNEIAIAIAERILESTRDQSLQERLNHRRSLALETPETPAMERTPYFCSGCPHSTGTKVPDGSVALSGIGCHFMAQWMDRNTTGYTQMGGEGASWIGESHFVDTSHVFQNIGDGTYFHSGFLAVRAAVASGANMTYKILFNDAVAMTGGQHVDGQLSVPQITRQVAAEGATKVVVVTDEPEKYGPNAGFAEGVTVHHRDDYNQVQKQIREVAGVSVIVYDQTCGSEKRRRRKRGTFPDPAKRAVINDLVCEGCGDCGVQSNCVSVTPLETEFGRKRSIDQSSCNKDFSCVKGFCPSFVTVHGGALKKGQEAVSKGENTDLFAALSDPVLPSLAQPYGILVNGIGGTGVVTIGAIVGMAAHLESKSFAGMDMAGLAQKGGAVWSHLQIANHQEDLKAARLGFAGASLILGCDFVTTASEKTMELGQNGKTFAIVNVHEQMTGAFTRDKNYQFPREDLKTTISKRVGENNVKFVEATRIATALMGNSIASNMFMLGYAYQQGLLPLGHEAINKAIEMNGAAIEMNKSAFLWGRRASVDIAAVERLLKPRAAADIPDRQSETLNELINRRFEFLSDYQNQEYAKQYQALVDQVHLKEQSGVMLDGLTELVARYYFKLMAYKDEYEVGRLYANGVFQKKVDQLFEGNYKIRYHLAPPLFAKKDPETGFLKKKEFGSWVLGAFKLLSHMRFLRGTAFDIFGWTAERKMERQFIEDYRLLVEEIINSVNQSNIDVAKKLLALPEDIKGFGHVKEANVIRVRASWQELLHQYRTEGEERKAA